MLRFGKATYLHAEDGMQFTDFNTANDKDFIYAEVNKHSRTFHAELNHAT
jgi:hypothetical protein